MSDRWNEPRAQAPAAWRSRWAERENERRLSQHAAADQRWQADLHDLDQMLGAARTFEGLPDNPHSPLVLKRGERIFTALPMVTLIEGAASDHLPMDAGFSWRATRTMGMAGRGDCVGDGRVRRLRWGLSSAQTALVMAGRGDCVGDGRARKLRWG